MSSSISKPMQSFNMSAQVQIATLKTVEGNQQSHQHGWTLEQIEQVEK